MKLFEIKNNEVWVYVPLKNDGKFRWKNRLSPSDYGKGFATSTVKYTEDSYVEWQIGYDVEVTKINKKPTSLTSIKFKGANNKIKHPYELSEIIDAMLAAKIITFSDLQDLIKENASQATFLDDEYKIEIKSDGKEKVGDLICSKQIISLPTFVYWSNKAKSPTIEVSIEKQQYGTGVQPMLYFSIPIQCFVNGEECINKTSNDIKENFLIFKINKDNKEYILNIFKLFACCSKRHNYDVCEILSKISEKNKK